MNEVVLIPLKYIEDERGAVMHFLKNDDHFFDTFGECYFSWVNAGIVKGWYRHHRNTSYLTSPTANLQVVLYDETIKKSCVIDITKENYGLIKIPIGMWYAFKSLSDQPALIVNVLNRKYDVNETERLPIDTMQIPFNWSKNA